MAQTATPAVPAAAPAPHKPWYKVLYIQVLIAIALGILVGHLYPTTGAALKPLGDGFIQLNRVWFESGSSRGLGLAGSIPM